MLLLTSAFNHSQLILLMQLWWSSAMSPFSGKTGRSTSVLDAFCPDLGSAVSPRGSGVTLEFFRRVQEKAHLCRAVGSGQW